MSVLLRTVELLLTVIYIILTIYIQLLPRLIREPVLFYGVSNQKNLACCFVLFAPMLDPY